MKNTLLSIATGLAAVTMALAPAVASAQSRTVPRQTEIDDAVRMMIQRDSLDCVYDNARFIGRNDDDRTLYEVACRNSPGFLLLDNDPATTVNCIANNASVAARRAQDPEAEVGAECTMEGNNDVVGSISGYIQSAGIACAVDEARWVGATNSGDQRYEVGCPSEDGYWFDVNAAGTVANLMPCLQVMAAGGTCQFTTAPEQATWVASLAAPSGRACQATTARFVGANATNGTKYYEVGCAEGAGFMVRTDNDNAFQAVVECAAASGIAGGCTLSEGGAVAAAATADYQRRLGEAGITCAIETAGPPRQETEGDRRTVVEFDCSDRPWGLVAFLPNGAGSAEQIDCLTADARIGGCSLTPRSDLIEELSLLMAARSNSPCSVEDFRFSGRVTAADGADHEGDVVELKCSQGTGYIAVVNADRSAVSQAQTCATSAQRGGARCEL